MNLLLLDDESVRDNIFKILEFCWKQYFFEKQGTHFFPTQHAVFNFLRIFFRSSDNDTQSWDVLFTSKWKTMVYKLPQINW